MERTHIREQEEREEVDKGVRKFFVLLEGDPDLLPTHGNVVFSLGQGRSRPRLLIDNYTSGNNQIRGPVRTS